MPAPNRQASLQGLGAACVCLIEMPRRPPELTVALADLEHELEIDQAFDDMASARTVAKPVVLPITRTDTERNVYVMSPTPIERLSDFVRARAPR